MSLLYSLPSFKRNMILKLIDLQNILTGNTVYCKIFVVGMNLKKIWNCRNSDFKKNRYSLLIKKLEKINKYVIS